MVSYGNFPDNILTNNNLTICVIFAAFSAEKSTEAQLASEQNPVLDENEIIDILSVEDPELKGSFISPSKSTWK